MNGRDLLNHCKNRDWDDLQVLLCSGIGDQYKILICAFFEANHPDEKKRQEYGLFLWDKKLNGVSKYTGVDLFDFQEAYMWAKDPKGLQDDKVAEAIYKYVWKNRLVLAQVLTENSPYKNIDSDEWKKCRDKITALFGQIELSSDEKAELTEKQLLEQKSIIDKELIKLKIYNKVAHIFQELLNLPPNSCYMPPELPKGYFSTMGEPALYFHPPLDTHTLNKREAALNDMGLKVIIFDHWNANICEQQNGVLFQDPIETVLDKLETSSKPNPARLFRF